MRVAVWSYLFLLASTAASSQPIVPNATFTSGAPSTTNNDDSCDISALPAATLLLPYFEVDIDRDTGESTLFSVTNVTPYPQIAHVTLWTDWAFPVFSFDIFLTGYDVQSISLLDVLRFGSIAPPSGTSSLGRVGFRSQTTNPLIDPSGCSGPEMRRVPSSMIEDLQRALTIGRTSACTTPVGGNHPGKAIGYATIDLVRSCDAGLPTDGGYFEEELLFDNVLIGDYQQLNFAERFAQGGTLVHIRAIPEGGSARATVPTFGRTFYSGLQSGRTLDRRQPLPSSFAVRWIDGSTGQFDTAFKIWREGVRTAADACAVRGNQRVFVPEVVRFDEEENPSAYVSECSITCPPEWGINTAATSRLSAADDGVFPPNAGSGVAGWMYLNLDDNQVSVPGRPATASQSWVITSMAAEGRYSVDVDANVLGNGCSPFAPVTMEDGAAPAIGPAPNENTKPAALAATTSNDDSCDITQAPAATLLLPYFEVNPLTRAGEDTIFTITNVTQLPRIARVTIWTDRAYPVFTFNVFLTGYDTQTISLFEVIATGRVAPPNGTNSGTEPGQRSLGNDQNPLLDIANCDELSVVIPPALIADIRNALTAGLAQSCGALRVGNAHTLAIGYLTIDVVDNCGTTSPVDPGYISGELLHDNVLIGDYQQINIVENFAQSSAMVHIRAIPEGGAPGGATTHFARTFYSRYQPVRGTADRRQPLPSMFAARWISGGPDGFNTGFKIWREGLTSANAGCNVATNATAPITEFVRFDEDENASTFVPSCNFTCPPMWIPLGLSSRTPASAHIFPPNPDSDVAGWMYLNLDNEKPVGAFDPLIASQNWVIVSMEAAGRYSVDFDAIALGNGCSPVYPVTAEDGSPPWIIPAENVNPW